MTTDTAPEKRLAEAVALREAGEDARALQVLLELEASSPDDAQVNLHCAWIHDKLGREEEAVPFYEKAISLGLRDEDLANALLGLGSTYRALGRYEEALETLSRGTETFPHHLGLRVFRALALYNEGRAKEACETLLSLLVATTEDDTIRAYTGALSEYSQDLDRIWP